MKHILSLAALLAFVVTYTSSLSLDPVASNDLEQYIKDDFTISLRHIRPRRKFRISIEALFMIDFPSAKNKFSFYLDRKGRRVTIDINSNNKIFSKHLMVPSLNETTTIRSLAIAFSRNVISLYIDCKDVAKEEIEFNLLKLYQNMEEPSVKLFRERKYPLYLDTTMESALTRASCQKMSKKRSGIKRKDNERKKYYDDGFANFDKNRKRDVREWHRDDRDRNEIRNNAARRGDIPIMSGDCDENLLKTLAELLAMVKQLREEVRTQRTEINYLRTLLENCAGCKEPGEMRIAGCQHSNPCFPGVTCHDTDLGTRCGRCPRGYVGDGIKCKPGITCEDNPCFTGVECYDTVEGAHCGACPHGYLGDGKNCSCEDNSCAGNNRIN